MKILSKEDGHQYPYHSLRFKIDIDGIQGSVLASLEPPNILNPHVSLAFKIGDDENIGFIGAIIKHEDVEHVMLADKESRSKIADEFIESKFMELAKDPEFVNELLKYL